MRELGDLLDTAPSAAYRQQNRRAEVHGDAGVEAQLARACYVGVVTSDDDDGVALLGHGVVLRDDVGQCGFGIGVNLLVGDAECVGVGEIGGGVLEQQFEDVVGFLGRAGDRAEDTDPGDGRAQHLQHAKRDGGFSGVTFRRGDVDTRHGSGRFWHAQQPSVGRRPPCH